MPDKIKVYDVGDRYDMSESDGDYDDREKQLLNKVRDRRRGKKGLFGQYEEDEQAVLGFDEHDDVEEDGEEGEDDDDYEDIKKFEHDSDIEDNEDDDDLPDRKAWGSKARNFYGTDYVDQDYDSLTAQEEERARLEEIEAKEIQQRLAKELNDADFSLDIFVPDQVAGETASAKKAKKKKDKTEITLKADLSDLSDRQKRELFRKEAPEFDGLMEDFERNLVECQETLEPVLRYLEEKNIREHPFVQILRMRYDLALSYCNNISFYLLLKSKKMKVKNHPVVKRMVQIKQLLLELEQKYDNSIKSQVEKILEHISSGEELIFEEAIAIEEEPESPPKMKKLAMLQKMELGIQSDDEEGSGSEGEEWPIGDEPEAKKVRLDSESEEDEKPDETMEQEEEEGEGDAKRKITYQMAKNKGLTAHKKKDQRNIRVKNRKKFQKALVRRKGAIRPIRTETSRYSGESSGIKAFVKRSIKLK